ncbi:iron-containing alcohol dehydrogenase [Aliiroseovarius sp. Z3]|uniref:iron-containing alcohol dehydrogenase n=1 Tax=Aliiroseovarius sp. Z3 TaxID=2811402 RepID=UPI0023B23352|nr:iron-containing alcohol dehydrogenase [Aliiroseovarius sp. Z3]
MSFGFSTPGKTLFGRGTADAIPEHVLGFGQRLLLVRGRSVARVDDIALDLQKKGAVLETVFAEGEPTVSQVIQVVKAGRDHRAQAVVAIGGGSAIDLGKAAAALIPSGSDLMDHLEVVGAGLPLTAQPLPLVAIPTTAGTGAEMTKNAVISVPDAALKVSLRDDRMYPTLAIVDPSLTDHAPREVTVSSGLDAVTQVIEPYLSSRANPLTDALCQPAIRMGLQAVATLIRHEDPDARDALAYVSMISGVALANAGLGAVHGLAGVIGGQTNLAHGLICANLLGPTLDMNFQRTATAGGNLERYSFLRQVISDVFDGWGDQSFLALSDVFELQGVPGLDDLLADNARVDGLIHDALNSSSMKANPVQLTEEDVRAILQMAVCPTA